MSTIAYVFSMKKGVPSFIYRETELLASKCLKIVIFSTKYSKGIYMPKKKWKHYKMKPIMIILTQILHFLRTPRKYITLMIESLQTNTIIDFLIGLDFAWKMKKEQVELIHCHEGLHSLNIGYYCKKINKIPLSVTIHADALYVNKNMLFTKRALNYCDKVITVTEYNKHELVTAFEIPKQKIEVIRLYANINKFNPNSVFKILIVGQWAERKGHEILLKAIRKLNDSSIQLLIVGKTSWGGKRDFVDVEKLVQKYGLENQTIFFKDISEETLIFLYKDCDLFCLPCRTSSDGNKEGLPVTLMEAMACAKPVISTYHTGIPELVPSGNLVPENDFELLTEKILKFKNSLQLRKTQGEMNRKIIEREYTPANIKKIIKVFNKMTD